MMPHTEPSPDGLVLTIRYDETRELLVSRYENRGETPMVIRGPQKLTDLGIAKPSGRLRCPFLIHPGDVASVTTEERRRIEPGGFVEFDVDLFGPMSFGGTSFPTDWCYVWMQYAYGSSGGYPFEVEDGLDRIRAASNIIRVDVPERVRTVPRPMPNKWEAILNEIPPEGVETTEEQLEWCKQELESAAKSKEGSPVDDSRVMRIADFEGRLEAWLIESSRTITEYRREYWQKQNARKWWQCWKR